MYDNVFFKDDQLLEKKNKIFLFTKINNIGQPFRLTFIKDYKKQNILVSNIL